MDDEMLGNPHPPDRSMQEVAVAECLSSVVAMDAAAASRQ
jgi:hypothetical protein